MNTAEIQRKLTFEARIVSVETDTWEGDSLARLEGEDEAYSYDCAVVRCRKRSTMGVTVRDGAGWEWSKEWVFEINRAGRVDWSVNFKREPDAPPARAAEMNRCLDEAGAEFAKLFDPCPGG